MVVAVKPLQPGTTASGPHIEPSALTEVNQAIMLLGQRVTAVETTGGGTGNLTELTQRVNSVEQAVTPLPTRLDNVEQVLAPIAGQIDALNLAAVTTLPGRIAAVEQGLGALGPVPTRLDDVELALAPLPGRLDAVEQTLDTLPVKVTALETAVGTTLPNRITPLETLPQTVQTLRDDLTTLGNRPTSLDPFQGMQSPLGSPLNVETYFNGYTAATAAAARSAIQDVKFSRIFLDGNAYRYWIWRTDTNKVIKIGAWELGA